MVDAMTTPKHIQEEIDRLRRELNDLKSMTALPNPPLHPCTMATALAKIVTLESQIAGLQSKLREAKRMRRL